MAKNASNHEGNIVKSSKIEVISKNVFLKKVTNKFFFLSFFGLFSDKKNYHKHPILIFTPRNYHFRNPWLKIPYWKHYLKSMSVSVVYWILWLTAPYDSKRKTKNWVTPFKKTILPPFFKPLKIFPQSSNVSKN